MKNLFVIVGMSNVGKSTTLRKFCEDKFSFEYFKNDDICNEIFKLFNIKPFGIKSDRWSHLGSLGNIQLASYWLHIILLQQIKGEIAFAEGYRYYFKDERLVLEQAVDEVFGNCEIHYVHLNPSYKNRKMYAHEKGCKPMSKQKIKEVLASFDKEFFTFEIKNQEGLRAVVQDVVGRISSSCKSGNLIDFPDSSVYNNKVYNIDFIKIQKINPKILWLVDFKQKVFARIKSVIGL